MPGRERRCTVVTMSGAPVPPSLAGRAFTLGEATALGLGPDTVRRWGLVVPTRSVRATTRPVTTAERASVFALALPRDAAFSHITAARLWSLPLPSHLESEDHPLDVMRPTRRGLVRRAGCRGHRGLESRAVERVDGLAVTSMPDTWADLAAIRPHAPGVDDLVTVGDAVLWRLAASAGRRPSAADAAVLRRVVDDRAGSRGARALGAAVALVRPGARSPMETRTRLVFHRAGFPEPELNATVVGRGGWLLEGDLVWRRQRVVAEYQGAVHADIRRRSDDAQRRGLAEDEGWTVVEVFAADVFRAARRVTLLLRTARALGIDPASLRIE
jgi:hypothetical protein